jgi:transposase InsO family protein
VWAADITYVPMSRGFMYLVAVMDWRSRKVLSWRLSNTLDTGFCVDALEEAIDRFGAPDIFNTDQGAQFTSSAFTDVLKHHDMLNIIIFICTRLTMVRSYVTGLTSGCAFTIRNAFTRPLTI